MNTFVKDNVEAIRSFLAELPERPDAGRLLCEMVDAGLDRLSTPGSGQTLQRWRALAAVAAYDLNLAKLYEAHTDALAILAEAGADIAPPLSVWGVWCAEPPKARLDIHAVSAEEPGRVVVDGVKAWCSGANALSHAIVSGWNPDGHPCLAAVDLDQAGVTVTDEGWHAVGMAETMSVDVHFDNARGIAVGGPDFYTDRPGFWQGGAGIAACWHGAAAQLASYLRGKLAGRDDPHALAHLGRADVALSASAAGLRAAAQAVDAAPTADSYRLAMRVRLATEQAAVEVMQALGRALGAAPICRDPWVARMMADLPVFLRQSHAERDLAALAQSTLRHGEDDDAGEEEWRL
ncbi:acyl-CoA dehydrogenase [Herbaspirillum hiltneri N3]|uniref:Acyl-CoA dehydrogenase n=1 Tax=Herbaspirillum hiltneri N3 TaxID=1262470 RepID=A0ABM5V1J8_9BURK|nr:acyl-CoA dehydrogenase [Herbaspirillum hiltneri]AKZ63446.1 acyl-CoA dehydrogenase [Herbaspirillum hiltneri N3]